MILRNPQALNILQNLEKFENSIEIPFIYFFIPEIGANFNNFQGSSTSAQNSIVLMLHMHLPVTQSFKTVQKCLAKYFLLYSFLHLLFAPSLCAVLVVEITPKLNFNRKKSILVCQKLLFKI